MARASAGFAGLGAVIAAGVASLCLSGGPASAADAASPAPDCATPKACADLLETYRVEPAPAPGAYLSSGITPGPIAPALKRLPTFGDEGVTALLPLLQHPNHNVRVRAGYALSGFTSIDARHVQTLIDADKSGAPWLELPIANTGTEAALDYLWRGFLADPQMSSNAQTFSALQRFGNRIRPLIMAQLEQCRTSDDAKRCAGVNALIAHLHAPAPLPIEQWLAIAQSQQASERVRAEALARLGEQRHPYALEVLLRRLEERLARPADPGPALGRRNEYDFDTVGLMAQIGRYGQAGARAGPLLVRHLDPSMAQTARVAAVETIGKVGFHPGAAAILKLEPEFEDNWPLAHAATEALGRLGAGSQTLERLAADHWYWLVRYNAERALNYARTGDFSRPGVAGDGDAPHGWVSFGYRYAGDFARKTSCPAGDTLTYAQFDPTPIVGLKGGDAPVTLRLERPSAAQHDDLRTRYGEAKRPGRVLFARLGDYGLLGSNAGEFGGGVEVVGADGKARLLINDNAIAVFNTGRSLLIVTGLAHGVLNSGDLWVVALGKDGPQVQRRIRLPSEARAFRLASPRTLIIGAPGEDLAITAEGRLLDPVVAGRCEASVGDVAAARWTRQGEVTR